MQCEQSINKRINLFLLTTIVCLLVIFQQVPVCAQTSLPAPVQMTLFRAAKLYNENQYAEAAKIIKKFQKAEKGKAYASHEELLFMLGNCYLALKDNVNAIKYYKEAVSRNASHTPSWQNMATAQYNSGEYPQAARSFMQAFQTMEKKDPELLYYSALCALLGGDSRQSVQVFTRLLADFSQKETPDWQEGMARALIDDGQNKRALPLLQKLVSVYTGAKKAQWSEILLYQYLYLGMNKQALDLAQALARGHPDDPRWWKAVAHVELEDNRNENALMAMMIISYIRPLDLQEERLMADLNLQSGIPGKALGFYEKILIEDPDSEVLRYLIYSCQRLGDEEKGILILEKYGAMVSTNSSLMMLKADLLYGLFRYRKALDAYMETVHLKVKKSGRAWLMAGYCAWQIDDYDKALTCFNKACEFPAQKEKARQAGAYIKKSRSMSGG